MSESKSVYRQMFDAQVQLFHSLMEVRQDARTECGSAEDGETHCSSNSRRPQQRDHSDDDDVTENVCRLPDTVAADGPSSDIVRRLTEKKRGKHEEALKHMNHDLSHVSSVSEDELRTVCQQLLTSMGDANHRLETMKVRMERLQNNTELSSLWQQVEEEVNQRKSMVEEFRVQLTECEGRRTEQIGRVLRQHCRLLTDIGLLPLPDVHRRFHAEATMLNQSLLANRRSTAHLLLRLQEENLQEEVRLRLLWEEGVKRRRESRVTEEVEKFRSLCSRNRRQQHLHRPDRTPPLLIRQRCDIISSIGSLVPPTCSTALVSDWFDQLTATNLQIDQLHTEGLHLLHRACEGAWHDLLAEAELSKVALSALQLPDVDVPDVDVTDIVRSQLLPLIGQCQTEDEERLAALNVQSDAAAQRADHLSRLVFRVMRGMALLWETHCSQLKRREEELQKEGEELRRCQHQHTQKREERVEELMEQLRQESSEEALRSALEKAEHLLKDVQHSHTQCVPYQWQVLDRLPSLLMDELLTFSSNVCSFFQLSHTYRPKAEDLQKIHLSLASSVDLDTDDLLMKPSQISWCQPISSQNNLSSAPPDWLTEAASALTELYDISTHVTLTTLGGVVYSGPAFRASDHNLPETHLSVFPEELLTHTLTRFRVQFLEKLERHFFSILQSAVTAVTERREAAQAEEQLHLQKLDLQHIENHVYQPRLDELRRHRRRADLQRQRVSDVLTSCRTELARLQTAVSSKIQQLRSTLCELEKEAQTANSSQRVQALSAALQDSVDRHTRDIQLCEKTFRRSVATRLDEARGGTTELLKSFRLFSEGGDCSPQELKQLHRRLMEASRLMEDAEESIYSELEALISHSLHEVKEASARLKERLVVLESEVEFIEKIQKMMRSTNILIMAEVARSNQQQTDISGRLEGLSRSLKDTQVSAAQTVSLVSSLLSELDGRRRYLDFQQSEWLESSRKEVDVTEESVVDVLWFLSRVGLDQKSAPTDAVSRRSACASASSGAARRRRKVTESAGTRSVRAVSRSIRTDQRFQMFGSSPGSGSGTFRSTVNTLLWSSNDNLLQAGEDFYHRERRSVLQLLPLSVDQWTESVQQSLLGYQEKTRKCLISSREELRKQLSLLDDLLQSVPSVLIGNHERQREAELREAVGGARLRLEETVAVSEREKDELLRLLRPSLSADDLHSLNIRELSRQQKLKDALCRTHLELQECVRGRGEEFATSLSSLTEQLLTHACQATSDVTEGEPRQVPESIAVTTETKAHPQLSASSSVPTATTASITKLSLRVQSETEKALKCFQQLVQAELSLSEKDKRRQLNQQQSWNTHWRQEIHTLSSEL